jgi:hypothetical protein
VQNFANVKGPQPPHNLDEHVPNLLLLDVGLSLLVVDDLLVQIAIVCELHHEAECATALVYKCLFITDNIRFVDRSQNAHLVEGVFALLLREFGHRDLLQRVYVLVGDPLDFVDAGVGAVPELFDDLEVTELAGDFGG